MALVFGMTRDDIAPLLGRAEEQSLLESLLNVLTATAVRSEAHLPFAGRHQMLACGSP
jgi:hypothetical protein